MTKFKKGDRVKIIGNHNSRGMEVNDQSDVGKIGKITAVFKSRPFPYVLDCTIYAFLESDLELVPEHTVEPKTHILLDSDFKVKLQEYNWSSNKDYQIACLAFIRLTKPTVKINDKEYILNEKLAKAIEEAEEL